MLLNLRAAVYEKMDGKLEEAAKDAKRMIQLDEKSVPGYLRAGKVLGLMEKWEKALGMYKYGLEMVPGGDKEREVCLCHVVGGWLCDWGCCVDIGFAAGPGADDGSGG